MPEWFPKRATAEDLREATVRTILAVDSQPHREGRRRREVREEIMQLPERWGLGVMQPLQPRNRRVPAAAGDASGAVVERA